MKPHHAAQIAVLCFIWSNVADNKWVALGAALNGALFTLGALVQEIKERI